MDAAGLEHATKLGQVVSWMDGWMDPSRLGRTDGCRQEVRARRLLRHLSVLFDAACDAIPSHVTSL